jgi:hypothetical protein
MPDRVTDIFDPNWQPGRKTKERAWVRVARTGEPFEVALAEIIESRKAAHLMSIAHNARKAQESKELKPLRRGAYNDKPQSVRAIPTGFETNRRAH